MAKEQWETYFDAVKKEDWKAAKNILQTISKQERNNPQTFMKIGDVCQRTGDKTESIAAYTHAAQLLRMQGFAQKALATYKIALRLDPHNPEIISRAEILMDEFEAAKTAPHMPSPTLPAAAVSEQPVQPEESAPSAPEASQPSDWLERTTVTPPAEEKIITAEPLSPDMASMIESTSLTAAMPPQKDAETTVSQSFTMPESVPESEPIAEPESEQPALQEPVECEKSEHPAEEPAKPVEEDNGWLESAYDALDTKMFKSSSERSAPTSEDDDSIRLVHGENAAAGEEDISDDIATFMTPLSERSERSVPEIFRDLPQDMVISFMNNLTVRAYRDRQHVIEEGDSGDSMYIMRSGRTRVIAHMLGRELELAVLAEGDIFGEVGFLTGRPRTAAVISDGPVEVYEISRLDIEKLIESNPEIMAKIEDFYETRVRDTIRRIKN